MSVAGMMKKIVPITRFNKGEASKVFEEVQAAGTKIVMKNNRPACILLSPGQYEALMDMLSDQLLLEEADRRMAEDNPAENLSHEEVLRSLGISREELDAVDAEIEE